MQILNPSPDNVLASYNLHESYGELIVLAVYKEEEKEWENDKNNVSFMSWESRDVESKPPGTNCVCEGVKEILYKKTWAT